VVFAAALAVLFSSGCADNKAKNSTAPKQISDNSRDQPGNKTSADETAPVKKKPSGDGPWPGYPSGMRYAAVSPLDFPTA